MKQFTVILAALFTLAMAACSQNKNKESNDNAQNMDKKVLVAYFSATGTTAREAKLIADAESATLYEIQPEQPYTAADLDWQDKESRSSVEMNDDNARPAIKETIDNIGQYDVIFLGYPIWWDLAPRVINTFIESNDLKGKTVIPFATSGGSSINNSVNNLKSKYPDINWQEGRLLNGADQSTVNEWVKTIK